MTIYFLKDKNSIKTYTAAFSYRISGVSLSPGKYDDFEYSGKSDKDHVTTISTTTTWFMEQAVTTEYSEIQYNKQFYINGSRKSNITNDESTGIYMYTSLNPGDKNTNAYLRVTATQKETIIKWQREVKKVISNQDGSTISITPGETKKVSESSRRIEIATGESDRYSVYTLPLKFKWSWNILATGYVVKNYIFASDIDKMIDVEIKYREWDAQADVNISGPRVDRGDTITASWYNSIANFVGCSTRVQRGQIMKPTHFRVLSDDLNSKLE